MMNLHEALDNVAAYLPALSETDADGAALIAESWWRSTEFLPILHVFSNGRTPEVETLRAALQALAPACVDLTGHTAAIIRNVLDEQPPGTVAFLDVDAVLEQRAADSAAFWSIVRSGTRAGATLRANVRNENLTWTPKTFKIACPKVLFSTRELPADIPAFRVLVRPGRRSSSRTAPNLEHVERSTAALKGALGAMFEALGSEAGASGWYGRACAASDSRPNRRMKAEGFALEAVSAFRPFGSQALDELASTEMLKQLQRRKVRHPQGRALDLRTLASAFAAIGVQPRKIFKGSRAATGAKTWKPPSPSSTPPPSTHGASPRAC